MDAPYSSGCPDEPVVGPDTIDHLSPPLQTTLSIPLALLPLALEVLPVLAGVLALPVFETILEEPGVAGLVRPSVDTVSVESALSPLALIALSIVHLHLAFPVEMPL